MLLIPAIDIIVAQAVRLYQGDYTKKQVVAPSAFELAHSFVSKGASYLHLVDLDGAKCGKLVNQLLICEIASSIDACVEVGGGIRTIEDIRFYLEHGVDRVIVGTAALQKEELLLEAISRYGAHIAVGLDCKDGYVYTQGWLTDSQVDYLAFAKHLETLGVSTIICTDIARDGTLQGPNLDMLQTLKQQVSMHIIASGGVKDLSQIQALMDLKIDGAISGKALVSGHLNLETALKLLGQHHMI